MDREAKIISLVNREKEVEVSRLAEAFNVSQVTIRKDLVHLEDLGFIKRHRGSVVLNDSDDTQIRLSSHYEEKLRIAQKAVELVSDNETIMIENGSTCSLFANEVATQHSGITIITNSIFIVTHLRAIKGVKLVLLGGEFQKSAQVNIGPMVEQMAANFYVDKLFVGVDGIDPIRGFTNNNLDRSEAARGMMRHAKQTIVLTDSTKFSNPGTVREFDFNDVSAIFTDDSIDDRGIQLMRQNQLKTVIV